MYNCPAMKFHFGMLEAINTFTHAVPIYLGYEYEHYAFATLLYLRPCIYIYIYIYIYMCVCVCVV